MKSRIWLGLLLALFTGHAWGAGGSSDVFIPGVANGPCTTWPKCPALPNDATHLFYFAPGTGVTFTLGGSLPAYASTPTFNLGTLNGAALDSSLQSIFGLMPGKNGDGGALSHTTNGALETGGNLATVANAQGAQGTGSTFNPPAGGSGILGYLSGIYKALTGTLTVSGTVTTGSASTDGSATQTTGGTAQSLFSGATPTNGWKISIPVAIASISTFACYVSDATTTPSATTAGSQMVYAGGQYSTEPNEKPTGPVYVNCPTTGQVISAKKW